MENNEQKDLLDKLAQVEKTLADMKAADEIDRKNIGGNDKLEKAIEFKNFIQKTMTSTSDSAVAPAQMSDQILETIGLYGIVPKYAKTFSLNSTSFVIPTTTGTPVAYFPGETSETSASNASTKGITISMKRLQAKVPVTQEILHGSPYDLQRYIANEVGLQFAKKIDSEGLAGSTFTGAYGGTAYTQSATGAFAPTFTDIINMKASIDPAFWGNSRFVLDRSHWAKLKAIATTTNYPIFSNEQPFMENSPYELVSDGVLNSTSVTSSGSKYFVYGDLSTIWLGTSGAVEVLADPYTSAAFGITNLYFTQFVGLGLARTNGICYYKIQ